MENITCDDNFQYIPVGMIIIYTRWYILKKKIPKFFFIVLKFSPGKDDQKCIYICICSPIFKYKKIKEILVI